MFTSIRTHTDAIGNKHTPVCGDFRIVSLVPSLTELLFDLGLGAYVVGRTKYCIHPRQSVNHIIKVGGTKNVKIDIIRELNPTHLLVNVDENRKDIVESLSKFIPNIIVTHPRSPLDNLDLYKLLGGIFRQENAAKSLSLDLKLLLKKLEALRKQLPVRHVLYLIWRKPWMSVSKDTYISGMLNQINWKTVELEGNSRYPVIDNLAAIADKCDMVLLSSEPYSFRHEHVEECRNMSLRAKVKLIDGELVSWYGSRAVLGLRYLAALAKNIQADSGHTFPVH